MTKREFMKILEMTAAEYVRVAKESIFKNKHMNDLRPEDKYMVNQRIIEAVIADYINYIGTFQGLDEGLYTHYLYNEWER
jgi:hypothetical protein